MALKKDISTGDYRLMTLKDYIRCALIGIPIGLLLAFCLVSSEKKKQINSNTIYQEETFK